MSSIIVFQPWIGQDYGREFPNFRKKTLILGGSHYFDDDDDGETNGDEIVADEVSDSGTFGEISDDPGLELFTSKVVECYFNPDCRDKWKKTFSTFINSVFGRPSSIEEKKAFFDSIVFYNYLQEAAGEDPYSAGLSDYNDERHLSAYYEVLDRLEPEVVICWGSKVWEALPNNWRSFGEADKGTGLSIGNQIFKRYYDYPYLDKTIRLIGVHHPSIGYKTEFHHQVFRGLDLIGRENS